MAYDAAQRGFATALVERADFGSGSSFNHAKTVHGGLRSLQSGDLLKARFSIGERRAMARIAPPLVTPLAFMMGTTRKLTRSTWAMRAGFLLDAAIGFDRNAGVPPHLRLPAGRVLGRGAYEAAFGSNARAGITGGAQWSDYHMAESDRLTLAFAQAAVAHGAVLANYVEATEALVRDGRLTGLRAIDRVSGAALDVEARVTVNAAGAACRPWMERFGARPPFPLLKAMNLVTSRPAGPVALGAPTSGGRLLLLMPWRGRLLVGTSHSDQPADPSDTRVRREELRDFVDEVNTAFPALALSERDVTLVHRGVVPAVRDRRGVLGLMGHHRIHDHAERRRRRRDLGGGRQVHHRARRGPAGCRSRRQPTGRPGAAVPHRSDPASLLGLRQPGRGAGAGVGRCRRRAGSGVDSRAGGDARLRLAGRPRPLREGSCAVAAA